MNLYIHHLDAISSKHREACWHVMKLNVVLLALSTFSCVMLGNLYPRRQSCDLSLFKVSVSRTRLSQVSRMCWLFSMNT